MLHKSRTLRFGERKEIVMKKKENRYARLNPGIKKLEKRIHELYISGKRIQYTIDANMDMTDYENYINQYNQTAWDIKELLDILYQNFFISKEYYDTLLNKLFIARPKEQ